jgi:hypothetical protein
MGSDLTHASNPNQADVLQPCTTRASSITRTFTLLKHAAKRPISVKCHPPPKPTGSSPQLHTLPLLPHPKRDLSLPLRQNSIKPSAFRTTQAIWLPAAVRHPTSELRTKEPLLQLRLEGREATVLCQRTSQSWTTPATPTTKTTTPMMMMIATRKAPVVDSSTNSAP